MSDADNVQPASNEPDAAGQPASIPPSSPRPNPNRFYRRTAPRPTTLEGEGSGSMSAGGVRPELRNWAVLDEDAAGATLAESSVHVERAPTENDLEATPAIEGTARVVAEEPAPAAPAPESQEAAPSSGAITGDQIDPILIAGLPQREVHVQPGSKATLVVSLLNNGPVAATFDVHLEGWVHESWLEGESRRRLLVQPGERAALPIVIAPPRDGGVTAGSFPLIVVVRSPHYAKRRTRLVATLVVQPFTDFVLGRLEPGRVALHAFRRRAYFALPVSNLGNHPLRLALQGQLLGLPGSVEFTDALEGSGKQGPTWLASPATLNLAPRQTAELYVRATVKGAPVLAARPLPAAVRVSAAAGEERRLPRSAAAEVSYRPALRPWHLLAAVAASFVVLVGAGLLALAARLLLAGPAPQAVAAPAAAPAPIVIVLNQPAPTSAAASAAATGAAAAQASAPQAAVPGSGQEAGSVALQAGVSVDVPLVLPGQVTRPGESAASTPLTNQAGSQASNQAGNQASAEGGVVTADSVTQPGQTAPAAAAPAVAAVPVAAAPARQMTFAEMFRDVALQYDLDWRLLAAQAYIESGFDSLALGADGDMGLMQVLPSTWREWAPAVAVSDPFDAHSNALVAAAYHDYLRAQLGKRGLPQAQWMLVAYNWGIDRLGDFLDAGGTWDELPAVRRTYAEDILRIARTIP